MISLSATVKVTVIVLAFQIGFTFGENVKGISDKCLQCICDVETNCNHNTGCADDGGTLSCGPFQIKEVYWIDCGRPGKSYKQCTKDYYCSKGCIKAYMQRYGNKMCEANCEGFARMHNGGPSGCLKYETEKYWSKIKKAGCSGKRG